MSVPSFQIPFQWRGASSYEFPSKLTSAFRQQFSVPAVYRWRVHPGDQGGLEELYIGEAENLARRVQHVLTPGTQGRKSTNGRLKEELEQRRAAGKHVFLDYMDFSPFELNGILITKDLYREPFVRKALEHLNLYLFQAAGHMLLNYRVDPVDKVARELNVPADQLRRALQAAGVNTGPLHSITR